MLGLTESLYNKIIELCKLGKQEKWDSLYFQISERIYKEFGVSLDCETIRGISKRYRKKNGLDENFNPCTSENGEKWTEDISSQYKHQLNQELGQGVTEQEILESHGIDSKKFSLVNVRHSKWTDVRGADHVSSRITAAPIADGFVYSEAFVKKLFDNIKIDKEVSDYTLEQYSDEGNILIISIADFHYMRYSTEHFSNEEYNREIARQRYYTVINDILNKVKDTKLRKIFFVVGNDMLNVDNIFGTTTKGTQQENVGDIESAIIEITNILVNTVERLKNVSPVEVIYIPSNHDYLTSFGIMNALRVKYEKDENVSVDCEYKERKYKKEGTCLMGFAHNIQIDKVNDLFIQDAAEYISGTDSRIYFLAHLHHEFAKDVGGTDVRRLPTIASPSRWEYNKGYQSKEKHQSFLIDPKFGITNIFYSYV